MKCVCESGLPQLYRAACDEYIQNTSTILPMQTVANDGTINSIDLTTIPVTEITFNAAFNASDATKRLHFINGIKNFAGEMGEPNVQSWDDGTSTELNDGQLSVSFVVQKSSPLHIAALQNLKCSNPGTFLLTDSGQFLFYANPDTVATDKKAYPLPVERWSVIGNPFTSSSSVAMVTVTIFFPRSLNFENLLILDSNEHELSLNKNYEARPVVLAAGAAAGTVTSINVTAARPSGGILGNSAPVSGLLPADFIINNLSTPGVVIALTANESPAGNYTVTFAPQTGGDLLEVYTGVSNTVSITIS